MRRLPALSEPQDKLDQPPAIVKRISKSDKTSTRYSGDFRNKSLKIEVSKSKGRLGEIWRQFMNHHLHLIVVCNKLRGKILGGIK